MDFAGSQSERFVEQPSVDQMGQTPYIVWGTTAPVPPLVASPPLPTDAIPTSTQEPTQPAPTEAGPVSVFQIDQERLSALQDLTWRRVRALAWVLVVGVALGLLLLIPAVRPPQPVPIHVPNSAPFISSHPTTSRPFWAALLLGLGIAGPGVALALGVLVLPVLLWRAAWLRRQQALHLAIGRQGLLFFLPGQMGHWFLLPWGHITALTDASTAARTGRRERLRTVLWRRWARLQRAFRHGRRLEKSSAARKPVHSPFRLHVRAAGPQQRLRVGCYARLPDSGYGWLFTLAPFTRRVGASAFLLDSGWFESATGARGASLHQTLLGLWAVPPVRAQRAPLPLPRARGAVLLNASASARPAEPAARCVDGAAWAALPLVPVLSVMTVAVILVTRQPLATGTLLNLATLCVLTLGLGLLLAGIRWTTRRRLFAGGACLLALAGALNLVYGMVAGLQDWPWSFQIAPGQPFFVLEALAGVLLLLGGLALGLEGSGRPGVPGQGVGIGLSERLHSAELVVMLGLLTLGLARTLEDIDLAALSGNAATLSWLRNTLAEPLLPLAIIGLSYCIALAGPSLQTLFRALQVVYGLVLALLTPAAFVFVYRAAGGAHPVPLAWLPLLALELLCGLLVVFWSLRTLLRARSSR